MLALSLEKLKRSGCAYKVRIFADTPANIDEVTYVRDNFYPEADLTHVGPHVSAPSGSWNILNSIRQGFESGAARVWIVEEDVMVRPGFFEWHEEKQATGCWLATCGRPDKYLSTKGDFYTNPGSCLSRELIEQLIPHINDEFFRDPATYVDTHFDPWPGMSPLDDGLIRRVIRKMGGSVLTARPGVCAHQGFRTYNRLDIYKNYETKIDKKIERLRQIILGIRQGDHFAQDFEAF